VEKIDYVDPQRCLRLRQKDSKTLLIERGQEAQAFIDDGIPLKRIQGPADVEAFFNSIALDRLLQVLLNISNRLSRFGILENDHQVSYLKISLEQVGLFFLYRSSYFFFFLRNRKLILKFFYASCLQSPTVRAVLEIFQRLDQWITEIPLDPTPQRFGNKAFKIWGHRLESVSSTSLPSYPFVSHKLMIDYYFFIFFFRKGSTKFTHSSWRDHRVS
jgi:hypothetical protein